MQYAYPNRSDGLTLLMVEGHTRELRQGTDQDQ
jgi:hypothetical protein